MKMPAATFAIVLFAAVLTSMAREDATNNSALSLKASEAKDHIGTNATVVGVVAEVNKAERLIRLNFDRPFPKQPFTAVIFAAHTNQFPEVEKLKGKQIQVTGKITEYRERPQIVVTSTNQLKVLETGPSAPAGSSK